MKIGIIGAGNVGKILAKHCNDAQILTFVVARSKERQLEILNNIYRSDLIFSSINQALEKEHVDILILAVPDNRIEGLSVNLSMNFNQYLENTVVVHLAGSLGLDELKALSDKSINIAAVHPYQTFYHDHKNILQNLACLVECSDSVFPKINDFIEKFKAKSIRVDANFDRGKYHASAVAASNYLTSAIELSKRLLTELSINPELFLPKIIETTIRNNFIYNHNKSALTGPISRGDLETVLKHIELLKQDNSNSNISKNMYAYQALATIELALAENRIDEIKARQMNSLLLKSIGLEKIT